MGVSYKATKTAKDVKTVSTKIIKIYAQREAAAFALAQSFAIKAHNIFKTNQSAGKYWSNKTFNAFDRVFANAFHDSTGVGFFLAHGIEYGIYLELANDRKHKALKPIMSGLAISFIRRLKNMYGIK